MFTADHPNAQWLDAFYRGGERIRRDGALDTDARAHRFDEHIDSTLLERFSPHFVIHTGGSRLAATGGMDFLGRYIRRRKELSDASVEVVEFGGALADDHYGIVWGTFRTSRGADIWERPSLGAWRFEGGMAAEHWELADGPRWDEFFLAGDPDFRGTAEEFWTRSTS
jgi:hypothetical protein